MKPWPFLWCCALLAGCDKPSTTDSARNEKAAPPAVATPVPPPVVAESKTAAAPKPEAMTKTEAASKPEAVPFDLVRETERVRQSVVGTWYQVDHSGDGAVTSLSLMKYFGDGTVRAEYWTLVNAERKATQGTDKGEWKLRGDTIVLHFEAQTPPGAETKPPAPNAAPASPATPPAPSPAASPADLPAAAAPAPAAAPAALPELSPARDDEQRLLAAAADWFTYEYRTGGIPAADQKPENIMTGVSVRVGSDFKMPASIPGYRGEGAAADPAPEPESATGKLLRRIFR